MASLGDLVGGIQSGYKFTSDARRNRQLEKAIDFELTDLGTKQMGKRSAIDLAREAEGGGQVDWAKFAAADDPYLFKMGRGIKNFFQKRFGDNAPYAGIPAGEQESGATTYAIPGYANGGRSLAPNRSVGHYRNGGFAIPQPVGAPGRGANYADGGEVELDEYGNPVTFTGSGPGLDRYDFLESAQDVGRAILPNTREHFREAQEQSRYTDAQIGRAEGAANKGRAIREAIVEGAKGVAHLGGGLIEDTGISPAIRGVGGFLGFGTDEAKALNASDDVNAAAVRAAVQPDQTSDVAAQPAPQQAIPSSGGLGGSTNAVAQSTSGEANVPGVESQQDITQIPGMTPDDMPSMNTQDWIAYRATKVSDLIAMGASPTEAHQQVTQMQQRGFMSNAQRAQFALQSGDTRGAALNLKAAYQYFPNGADVKFGMTQDKNGRPALISMGVNEETGEPQGNPVLLNEERLAAMIQNFQSPDAFTAWTKDWRDEQFKERQYKEVTKPAAQQAARTSAAQADYYRSGVAKNKAAGTGGGLKASDRDRAAKDEFKARAFEIASMVDDIEDPEQLTADLTQVMGEIYTANPSVPPTTISNEVIQAYRLREQDGGAALTQLLRRYGLVQ